MGEETRKGEEITGREATRSGQEMGEREPHFTFRGIGYAKFKGPIRREIVW
jgi:hypothetical protein